MDSRHPLEIICSHRTEQVQLMFALRAIELLPTKVDFSVAASIHGLVLCGETEAVLTPPIELLKAIFGEQLRVGEPAIRYRHGAGAVEEPYMGVRVRCAVDHFAAVKDDIVARGGIVLDSEVAPPIAVLRATVSLARLLGYAQQLATLTSGTGREVIWFSHYGPIEPRPRVESPKSTGTAR